MKLKKLLYSIENGIGFITMNSPENLNAIDERMAEELLFTIREVEKDPRVKVLVIRSLGKAFSAGGDLGYFYKLINSGKKVNIDSLIKKLGEVSDCIKRLDKLVIASVNGAAAGAGMSLALSCDFILCDDRTKFIMAFVNLGLVPDTGASYLLSKAIGDKKALGYAISGRPIPAEEAKKLGLVHEIVTTTATNKFANSLASGPLIAYKNIKKQIYEATFSDYRRYLEEVEIPDQRECAASKDFSEGVRAFVEKRPAVFKGQ